MSHRLPIHRDELSFDERTERLMRDVRRRMDEDLQRFGFGRSRVGLGGGGSLFGGSDLFSRDHDFFQLRPSIGAGRESGSPRREEWGSRESLDDDTTKKLYRGTGAGAVVESQANGAGRVFSMNFDVKDYRPEDISVTVEDETLVVQAKRKIEKDGGVSTKEFSRKIKIPPDVDPEKLTSSLTSDGILTVEAPAPPEYGAGATDRQITETSSTGPGEMDRPDSSIPLDTPIFSSSPDPSGRRSMQLRLEVGSPYTPDDIVVKLEGRTLIVEAIHEEKSKGRTSKTSMQRDFDLSEDIDLSTVQAMMRSNGQLYITALV